MRFKVEKGGKIVLNVESPEEERLLLGFLSLDALIDTYKDEQLEAFAEFDNTDEFLEDCLIYLKEETLKTCVGIDTED